MKTSYLGTALLVVTLAFSTSASAQHRPFHGERHVEQRADGRGGHRGQREFDRGPRHERGFDRRDQRRWDRIENRRDARDTWGHGHRPFHAHPPAPRGYWQHDHRGVWRSAGPAHRFHRGGRLPPHFASRHTIVRDWHRHRLAAPPHGHHWVQAGPDFVLAAVATGLILHIVLGQ